MNNILLNIVKVIITDPDKAHNRNIIVICEDDYVYYFKSIAHARMPDATARWRKVSKWEDNYKKIEIWKQRVYKTGKHTGKHKEYMKIPGTDIIRRVNRRHISECHQDLLQYIL